MVSMKADQTQFVFVGNNLAIDFVNTQVTDRGELVELLNDRQDLFNWANAAEILLDSSNSKQQIFADGLEFREALKQTFTAVLDTRGVPSSALNKINQHLFNYSNKQELKKIKGKFELRSIYRQLSIERLFGLIAYEAALFLESDRLEKLRRCANPKCVLLFVDTSRSGKRRWCSMDVCGNRSKAASHYNSKK